jgi:hypothetical protein
MASPFRFSIKNASNTDIEVKLLVGKIPHPQAQFDEFELIPNELYALVNEYWANETHRTVKPQTYINIVDHVPIAGFGESLDTYPLELLEKEKILRENLLNKFISFVLTISKNGTVIYKTVGWNLPDEDMEKHQVNDTLLGYYNTTPENYKGKDGTIRDYPLFYSKLITDETGSHFGGRYTFYIKATSDDAFVQELNFISTWVDEDDYWGK